MDEIEAHGPEAHEAITNELRRVTLSGDLRPELLYGPAAALRRLSEALSEALRPLQQAFQRLARLAEEVNRGQERDDQGQAD